MKLIFTIVFIGANLFGQGLKITHMEGTYDLDGDGLQEFASVELGVSGNKKISVIRYYELDENGYQKMTWELEAPDGLLGSFVDVELGDLNGDGIPELITVSNLAEPDQEELLQPIAFYYYWDGERFSEEAG
ncbi:MAG: FG-GAP repeat domain-containing protein, partial [Fidelibacterota bacterium]